jgi:phospholipid/cholesterol/gamma-HCH transport system substrate-binding protein
VAGTYADVAPELVRILDNAGTLSNTLQEKEAGLNALLLSVTRVSDNGHGLMDESGGKLVDTFETLRPTTGLLAYYAPEFPCVFATANRMRMGAAQVVGGQYDGIHASIAFLPGQPGYQKGLDDPKVAAKNPPTCYEVVPHGPHIAFDDGTTTVDFYRKTTEVVTPLELARRMLGSAIDQFVAGGGR